MVSLNGANSRGTDSGSAPGQLLLTDPENMRVGYDAGRDKQIIEIPFGSYDPHYENDHAESDAGPAIARELHVGGPKPGRYSLRVIGHSSGRYNLLVGIGFSSGGDFANRSATAVQIQAGTTHTYAFWYDPLRVKDTRLEFTASPYP